LEVLQNKSPWKSCTSRKVSILKHYQGVQEKWFLDRKFDMQKMFNKKQKMYIKSIIVPITSFNAVFNPSGNPETHSASNRPFLFKHTIHQKLLRVPSLQISSIICKLRSNIIIYEPGYDIL
jgi:hypothetical protein